MDFKDLYSKAYDQYHYQDIEPTIDVGGTVGKVPEPVTPQDVTEGGYAALRGFTDAELSLFGELEGLYNGVKNVIQNPENQQFFDSFMTGLEKETNLPRFNEVRDFLNKFLPEVSSKYQGADVTGQLVAPGALMGVAGKAARAAKKSKEAVIVAPAVSVAGEKQKKGSK